MNWHTLWFYLILKHHVTITSRPVVVLFGGRVFSLSWTHTVYVPWIVFIFCWLSLTYVHAILFIKANTRWWCIVINISEMFAQKRRHVCKFEYLNSNNNTSNEASSVGYLNQFFFKSYNLVKCTIWFACIGRMFSIIFLQFTHILCVILSSK